MRRRRKTEPYILKRLFELWGVKPVVRDHAHCLPANWVDEPVKAGKIRTHCKLCGDFIGYRPARMGNGVLR